MNHSHCLNCNAVLTPDVKFCPECGQSKHIHRFTMANFLHEGFHAFTHTDKGIFHLLKALATKPGTTARNFIKGKRKRYFNPFTFFLILMGIFVLSNNYFKKEKRLVQPNAKVLERIPSAEGRENYIAMMERVNISGNFFNKHGNVVAMIAVPFISLFTFLFFRRKEFNYAEHLTANMMFVAFSNLVFTLIIFPLSGLMGAGSTNRYILIAMLLQAAYFAWGLNGFLELNTTGQRIKSFTVSIFTVGLWALFSITLMAIYVYQSWHFYEFFSRMSG